MNSRRFLFLLLGILYGQLVNAQCRILYSSQDLVSLSDQYAGALSDTANPIMSIESRGALSKYLIVRYARTKRKLLAKKSIWGYVDSNKAIWRSYQKELFLVIKDTGGWIEYAINRPVRTRLTAMYAATMYSRTLDSKIKSNWLEAMADVPPGYVSH